MLLTASLTLPVQPEYYRRTFIEKCTYFLEGAIFYTPIFYLDEKKSPKNMGYLHCKQNLQDGTAPI